MKILLFGKNGQVGWELNRALQPLGEVIALGRQEADFSSPETLHTIVRETQPDIIVNAVAYTAVDKAEEEEELATVINGVAPGVLAEEALKVDALLVHYSTDYVFDGSKDSPYVEADKPNPINVYGRSKLAGERAVQSSGCDYLIFRTSWVYAPRGHNFLFTILKLAKERDELSIVADQTGSPTTARIIAETSCSCIKQAMQERRQGVFASGLYHLTASGYASWYDFAVEIIKVSKQKLDMEFAIDKVTPIPTVQYPTPAARPINSRLLMKKLNDTFNVRTSSWQQALSVCIEDLVKK